MVIAHFSKRNSLTYALGFLVACAVMYSVTLYHPQGTTWLDYTKSKGLYRYEFALVARICGALLVIRQLTILKQIIVHGSSAIWTANDRLFYLNIYSGVVYRSVRLSDVSDFKIKTGFAAAAGIVICLRSGREKVISTLLLLEPADVVLSHLRSLQREGNLLTTAAHCA